MNCLLKEGNDADTKENLVSSSTQHLMVVLFRCRENH